MKDPVSNYSATTGAGGSSVVAAGATQLRENPALLFPADLNTEINADSWISIVSSFDGVSGQGQTVLSEAQAID